MSYCAGQHCAQDNRHSQTKCGLPQNCLRNETSDTVQCIDLPYPVDTARGYSTCYQSSPGYSGHDAERFFE